MTDSYAPLPSSLRQDANYQALNSLLNRQGNLDLTKLLIYWLDTVDAAALPHLAEQFHILGLEGWDFATTVAQKRALLKQAVELHRYKGTPWAVRQGIRRYDSALDIQEWWQYGGQPFHFKLVGGQVQLSLSQAVKLFRTIEATKNLRSWLDGGVEGVEEGNFTHTFRTASRMSVSMAPTSYRQSNGGAAVLMGVHTRIAGAPVSLDLPQFIPPAHAYVHAFTRLEVLWR